MTQAGVIKDALAANGHAAELVIISTEGDRSTGPIADIGVGVVTAAPVSYTHLKLTTTSRV